LAVIVLRPRMTKGNYMSFTRSLIARSRDQEDGFTLIELMVVVLIIAILIAIAIPTFLGARSRAQDRAAQSDLRNGLTAEKTVYTDNQAYDKTTATMKGIEASLNWNGGDATKPALNVQVGNSTVGTNDIVCLDQKSKAGTIFAVTDIASGPKAGTYFSKGAVCPNAPDESLAVNGSW
jgi:type IV pilus assembly protein PilA